MDPALLERNGWVGEAVRVVLMFVSWWRVAGLTRVIGRWVFRVLTFLILGRGGGGVVQTGVV